MYNNVLVISDNKYLINKMKDIINFKSELAKVNFLFKCSKDNINLMADNAMDCVDVKRDYPAIIREFDLVISLHCKQFFPIELIESVKCINIHPGLNPYNRGWYPQVFSLINKLPVGATIHEMDDELDHGGIIVQEEVQFFSWDTSLTVYERVLESELKLINNNITKIIQNNYAICKPKFEGNLNLKKDFFDLCKIDLNELGTFGSFIDRLRALTHGEFKNAFFIDDSGNKVFISLNIELAKQQIGI